MNTSILLIIGFVLFMSILMLLFFITRFKSGSPEKALIIHGKLDPEDKVPFKVMTSGSTFVWPVIQKYYYYFLDEYEITSEINVKDNSDSSYKMGYQLTVSPSKNKLDLDKSITCLFGKDKQEIIEITRNRIEILIKNEISDKLITKDSKKEILRKLSKAVQEEFSKIGFENPSYSSVYLDFNSI